MYRDKFGPFNPTLRTDAAIARALLQFTKGATMRDFMPWPKLPEPEASIDGVFGMLKTAASNNRKRK